MIVERHVACLAAGAALIAALLPLTARADPAPSPATAIAIPIDDLSIGRPVVMQAHAETLRPAPLPDPDVSAPGPSSEALAAQADPSLQPGIFNPQAHFAGDGYAPGSSVETDHDHRHSTGGGMNLSIPMP